MRPVLSFVVTLLLGVASFAIPSPRSHHHVVHETRAIEPINWVKTSRLDSNRVLPMRFGLVQQNLHRLEEMLTSVSHPESLRYAQHLTPLEVVDAFAPSEETISAVTHWLVQSGFSRDRLRLSANKGWIHVNASTSEVENLLNTEYHIYTHPSGDSQIGCHNYSLPSHLLPHVDLIKPTVHFNHQPAHNARLKRTRGLGQPFTGRSSSSEKPSDLKRSEAVIRSSPLSCNELAIDLDCLRDLYQINYTPQSTHNNSFAIVGVTPEAFLGSDLDLFFSTYAPDLISKRPQILLLDQGAAAETDTSNQNLELNTETSLDLEYAMSLTSPQPITLLQIGDFNTIDPFNIWIDAVDDTFCDGDNSLPGFDEPGSCSVSTVQLPNVVSISYGFDEAEFTTADATRQCQEYAKLGMMGVSVIYASGDNGVAGLDGTCLDSNHQLERNGTVFNPMFPASCPYVTSVGATQLQLVESIITNDPETAWGSSGGGFSNIFPLPEYQKDAVRNYSQKYLNPTPFASGQYNDSGNARGFPDMASLGGTPYLIAVDGAFVGVTGTSASTPTVASIITMINDARITNGKRPLGFLNPMLYSAPFASAINDITTGSNPGCGTDGFKATEGWDPVTGLGTPNFELLLDLFLTL